MFNSSVGSGKIISERKECLILHVIDSWSPPVTVSLRDATGKLIRAHISQLKLLTISILNSLLLHIYIVPQECLCVSFLPCYVFSTIIYKSSNAPHIISVRPRLVVCHTNTNGALLISLKRPAADEPSQELHTFIGTPAFQHACWELFWKRRCPTRRGAGHANLGFGTLSA